MIPQYKQQRLIDHIDETLEALEPLKEFVSSSPWSPYGIIVKDLKDARFFVDVGIFDAFDDDAISFKSNTSVGGTIDYHFDALFNDSLCPNNVAFIQRFNKAADAWSEAQAICLLITHSIFNED